MFTVGILIAMSGLAQAPGGDLGAYYQSLMEAETVKVWLPDEILADARLLERLPRDYADINNTAATYRGGKLTGVRPLPSGNEFYLDIVWDEPWFGQPATRSFKDTIRVGGRPYKLNIVSEGPVERQRRHRENWERIGYMLIGEDPLDAAQWARADEVDSATRALELLRQNEAQQAALADESAETGAADATAAEPQRRGVLAGRGPQVLIALAAVMLAGIVVKTLVM